MSKILDVKNLRVSFNSSAGRVHAVNGISFSLEEGEMLGVVGESGCGKSITMLSLIDQVPRPGSYAADSIVLDGQDLTTLSRDEIRAVKGKTISMIFQNPMTALNPVLTIGSQITEALRFHLKMSAAQADEKAVELLRLVGISAPQDQLKRFPHQFSGGMLQRIMIAIGISCNPRVLLADEPTTALDVTIQAQIVELVKRMRKEINTAIIWVTHDLGVIAGLVDRVAVMYAGFIVEEATVQELFKNPAHPYTNGLLASLPKLSGKRDEKLSSIEGMPPSLLRMPSSCPFYDRCGRRISECHDQLPTLREISPGHRVACLVAG
jgi:oligopeptide transport system ATP-binding protein